MKRMKIFRFVTLLLSLSVLLGGCDTYESVAKFVGYETTKAKEERIERQIKARERKKEEVFNTGKVILECTTRTKSNIIVIDWDDNSCTVNSNEMELIDGYPEIKCKYSTFTDSKWENIKKSAWMEIHAINRETLKYKYRYRDVTSSGYTDIGRCKFIKDKRLF